MKESMKRHVLLHSPSGGAVALCVAASEASDRPAALTGAALERQLWGALQPCDACERLSWLLGATVIRPGRPSLHVVESGSNEPPPDDAA